MDEFEIRATSSLLGKRIWTRNDLISARSIANQAVIRIGFEYAEVFNTFGGHRSDPLYTVSKDSDGNVLILFTRSADMKELRTIFFPGLQEKYLSATIVVGDGDFNRGKPFRIDAYEVQKPSIHDKPTSFWLINGEYVNAPKCECCSITENIVRVNGSFLCLTHADQGFTSDTTGEHANKYF